MKTCFVGTTLMLAVVGSVPVGAQQAAPLASVPGTVVTSTMRNWGTQYANWLMAAFDSIPADKYGYKPTPVPAKLVKHPRIGEAAASFECKVERRINFGPEREMVVGEILLIHARDGIIDPATKRISEELYRPIGRLFANRYCTTRERFNLP